MAIDAASPPLDQLPAPGLRLALISTAGILVLALGCHEGSSTLLLQPATSTTDTPCSSGFEHENPRGISRCLVPWGEAIRFELDRVPRAHVVEDRASIFGRETTSFSVLLEVDGPVSFCRDVRQLWMVSLDEKILGTTWWMCLPSGIFGGAFRSKSDARATYRSIGIPFDADTQRADPTELDLSIWTEICELETLRRDDAKYPVDCLGNPPEQFRPSLD